MDILDNTSKIYYSDFLFKNYLKVWLKLVLINKNFLPYAISNLVRNNLNSTDFLLSIIRSNKITLDTKQSLINSLGKRDNTELIYAALGMESIELLQTLLNNNNNTDYLKEIELANRKSKIAFWVDIRQNRSAYVNMLIKYNTNYNYDQIVNILTDKNKFNIIDNLISKNVDIKIITKLLNIFGKIDYSDIINRLAIKGDLNKIKLLTPYDSGRDYIYGIRTAAENNFLDLIQHLAPLTTDSKRNRFFTNLNDVIFEVIYEDLNPEIINIVEPYTTDKDHSLPINQAAIRNKTGIIRKLAPQDQDKRYVSAIENLSKFKGAERDLDLIKYLAKISNTKTFDEIINQAAQAGDIELVKILAPYDFYKDFNVAMQKALKNKDYEMVRFLDRLN